VFGCLFLDSQHQVLAWREMFRGSINRNSVYPREVVKEAMALNAASVIIAHNHPSGGIQPSKEDLELTRTLSEILKVIDVRVLDHLIVGEEVLSLSETGHHSA
jgi:DNA repair protein RadC